MISFALVTLAPKRSDRFSCSGTFTGVFTFTARASNWLNRSRTSSRACNTAPQPENMKRLLPPSMLRRSRTSTRGSLVKLLSTYASLEGHVGTAHSSASVRSSYTNARGIFCGQDILDAGCIACTSTSNIHINVLAAGKRGISPQVQGPY